MHICISKIMDIPIIRLPDYYFKLLISIVNNWISLSWECIVKWHPISLYIIIVLIILSNPFEIIELI